MKDAKAITKFVKEVFSMYSIEYLAFFSKIDDNYERVSTPIFEKNVVTKEKLDYLSVILGMSAEDISETNREAALKTFKKYPFFNLLKHFQEREFFKYCTVLDEGGSLLENRLLYAIFGEKIHSEKYSSDDLIRRLEKQLKEYDAICPGIYHQNAQITNFHYEEATLLDNPECELLLKSFFEVYDRLNDLFFKAWKEDLSQEEINEYNLFVTYFMAKEQASSNMLYYDVLRKHRQIYIDEGYTKLSSYMQISTFGNDFQPWICKQFADNKELAQRYQDVFPRTKDNIRRTCMGIKFIRCTFQWSDAPFDEDPCFLTFPEEFGKFKKWTTIYIPKTKDEIGRDEERSKALIKLAAPAAKGGLINRNNDEVPKDIQTFIKRINMRNEVK